VNSILGEEKANTIHLPFLCFSHLQKHHQQIDIKKIICKFKITSKIKIEKIIQSSRQASIKVNSSHRWYFELSNQPPSGICTKVTPTPKSVLSTKKKI